MNPDFQSGISLKSFLARTTHVAQQEDDSQDYQLKSMGNSCTTTIIATVMHQKNTQIPRYHVSFFFYYYSSQIGIVIYLSIPHYVP